MPRRTMVSWGNTAGLIGLTYRVIDSKPIVDILFVLNAQLIELVGYGNAFPM